MTDQTDCPCGSGQRFAACCGQYIQGGAVPQTALALMRSRYTAYSRGDSAWLRDTWHPATRRADLHLDDPVRWIGLKILSTQAGGPDDSHGVVEFAARYKVGGRAFRLHERSRFQRRDGRWFYVDGDLDPDHPPERG